MLEALALISGYLLGSIPTAYIAGRLARGEDIRKMGGGNMGALNATRELGLAAGFIVLVIDIAKGAAAILFAMFLGVAHVWVLSSGFAAIVGHCWPVFLRFRGGKGAATTIGVFFALAPIEFVCSLPVMVVAIHLTSNVTLGMAAGFALFPLFLWIFGQPLSLIIYVILVALFLLVRYFPTAKRNFTKASGLKNYIIEKNYKPWQTRRK